MIEEVRRLVGVHGRLLTPIEAIRDRDDLWQQGMASFAAVQLLVAVEETFDVEFDVLNGSMLQSIETIAGHVVRLRAEQVQA